MDERDVFQLADRALARVVARINPDQWEVVLPPTFATRRHPEPPSLRTLVNCRAYDDAWVPDMLAGKSIDEVGLDTFDGDLLGNDPVASFEAFVDLACAAASVADLDAVAHLSFGSFGDYPVREYFWQINQFRALRAYDIAREIGVDPDLPAELVRGLWDELTPQIEEWRTIGIFPAAVPVPDEAPLLHRLLGLTGRRPSLA